MAWLWVIPAFPLLGALLLALLGGALPRRWAAAIGCVSVGAAWVIGLVVAGHYLSAPPAGGVFRQTLYDWIGVGPLRVSLGLYLDQLSLVFLLVITFIGFLIHLYSVEFMGREEGYSRFFCYLNLFVGLMLLLVLGDNLVSLYLGWEGVGLCSYLLIGFWYLDRANGRAARKAFLITRLGDTSLVIAFFLIFSRLGTLDIQQVMREAPALGAAVTAAALLVLGGAVGKSAQIPLHTWLPDAMAGPTPVSALIHAATMVTAGVYLLGRTHALFALSPLAMTVVAAVGIATALYGAASALAQRDLKRVLAYSTMSQIGYMFIALGVGAWAAGVFHFVTHACFKALLFLSAGMVIQALREEHDITRMGGLWRRLPVAGWTFLIGAASLSALPLVTAGFYSKDAIIWATWASPLGSAALLTAALVGDALTAVYIFRTFFLVFLGERKREVERLPGPLMRLAVIVLAVLSLGAGVVSRPAVLGGFDPLGRLLSSVFGVPPGEGVPGESAILLLSALATFTGIAVACLTWARGAAWAAALSASRIYDLARQFLSSGWGCDWLYDRAFVRPYLFLTGLNREDAVDSVYTGLALAAAGANRVLSLAQSGRVRNYATAILLGAVLVVALLVLRGAG